MPGHSTVPTIWVGPVRSHCTPMTISLSAAIPGSDPVRTASAISRGIRYDLRMSGLLSSRTSVREWPDAEIVADVPPESVQPFRLHDQEEDDQGPEQHEAEVGNEVEDGLRGEEEAPEGLHRVADDDRQQRDEERAEDGPEHRAEPADDDHRQVVDRD